MRNVRTIGLVLAFVALSAMCLFSVMPDLNPLPQYRIVPEGHAYAVGNPQNTGLPAATIVVSGSGGPTMVAPYELPASEYSGHVSEVAVVIPTNPPASAPVSQPAAVAPTTSPAITEVTAPLPTVQFVAPVVETSVPQSRVNMCEIDPAFVSPGTHTFPVFAVPGGIMVRQYPEQSAPGTPVEWVSESGDKAIRLSEITGWYVVYQNDIVVELFARVQLKSNSGWIAIELNSVPDNGVSATSARARMVSTLDVTLADLATTPRYKICN